MAIVTVYDPTKLSSSTDLNVDAINNDPGATYNSALLDAPVSLLAYNPTPEVDSLMELPANIAQYGFADPVSTPNAIPNLMNDWNISIGGDVSNGWNIGFNSDGSWDLTNQRAL